jgi:DNA invertase Pin-like site-specific DNA recombinase
LKLVGYARTSKVIADGVSDDQEVLIRVWCREHHYRLTRIVRDIGGSGSENGTDRPGLASALTAIREGEAEGLVVLRLDRLARKPHVQEAVLQRAWQEGGRVFEVEGGEVLQDDPEDPVRTFVRQVMGAAAELERNMNRRRLHNNRREAALEGRYVGGRRAPRGVELRRYGYRLVKNGNGKHRYEPVPEEQAVIEQMRMRRERDTFQAIADWLNAEGTLTASGTRAWNASTVRKVLLRHERIG